MKLHMARAVVTMINHEETGARIRARREELGYTLHEVAGYTGYSVAFLSMLELGKRKWTEEIFSVVAGVLT